MGADRRADGPAGRDGAGRLRAAALGALVALVAACGGGADEAADVALAVECTPDPPSVGPTTFALTLSDTTGAPLSGAAVEVEGNMNHAGMVPVFGTAGEVEPGRYELKLELTMGGDWFLLVEAELADGRAVELTHDLPDVRSGR